MWKWVGWAGRLAATAVLLSFLSIWTTGYIVNSYMEALLKQMDLPLQVQPFALSGVWGRLWGASPAVGKSNEASAGSTAAAAVSGSGGEKAGGVEGAGALEPSSSSGSQVAEATDNVDGAGEGGQDGNGAETGGHDSASPSPSASGTGAVDASGADAAASDGGENAVPVFQGNAGILNMTDEQRKTISDAMSKLNAEQLSKLSGYLEDGLTEEELRQAGELLKPVLSGGEYDKMMELLRSRAMKPDASEPAQAAQPN